MEKKKQARQRKPRYKYHPGAVNITLYSADGSPIPDTVMETLIRQAETLALDYNLLTTSIKA